MAAETAVTIAEPNSLLDFVREHRKLHARFPGRQRCVRHGLIAMRGYCFPVRAGTPIPETSLDSCARPDFWRGVCDIFIDVQHILSAELHELEEKRCHGYDRQGSNLLSEALHAWRAHGENRYADMLDFESLMFVWEGTR